MTAVPAVVSWRLSKLSEALQLLATESGLSRRSLSVATSDITQGTLAEKTGGFDAWLQRAAGSLGLEAVAVETPYAEIPFLLRNAAPAFLMLPRSDEPRALALLRSGKKRVFVLGEDHNVHTLSLDTVRELLCADFEGPVMAETQRLLSTAGVAEGRQAAVREAIAREYLGQRRVSGCWILRLPAGASLWRQLHQLRLTRRLYGFVAAHITQLVLLLVSWRIIGKGALEGRLDSGWLLAWALALVTLVPIRILMVWWRGVFAIGFGQVLKQRLLCGGLRLSSHEVRHQGAGQLLGRVIESEALGASALSAALGGLVAVVELCFAGAVLSLGAGGPLQVVALVVWTGLAGATGWMHLCRTAGWATSRLAMTHDLVERMVGYRTRLAQQTKERWHVGEDNQIRDYLDHSEKMDRVSVRFSVWVVRGWQVIGLFGLAPVVVEGIGSTSLAIGLGGVLLASQALATLTATLPMLSLAVVVWQQVAPLFRAAARPQRLGAPDLPLCATEPEDEQPVVQARRLTFRFHEQGEPVLQGCDIRVAQGERIMVEGRSGAGKSTLASILAGVRQPDAGLVLVKGLDGPTLGTDSWRRLVAAAPQSHENHIFTGTLAFNLLMGRRWPADEEDLREAKTICCELGLGGLLERMPAGLNQVVGDTGWSLSHGEKARIYVGRALLQGAELVIFDESFAALDPDTLRTTVACALRHARALLVIAHP